MAKTKKFIRAGRIRVSFTKKAELRTYVAAGEGREDEGN